MLTSEYMIEHINGSVILSVARCTHWLL